MSSGDSMQAWRLLAFGRETILLYGCTATGKRSALPSVPKADIEGSPFESREKACDKAPILEATLSTNR